MNDLNKIVPGSMLFLALTFCGSALAADPVQEDTAADIARKAEAGDAYAQCRLAIAYIVGDGVPKDYLKARNWAQKSAAQKFAHGQFILGICYWLYVEPADKKEAEKWLQTAAQGHDPQAQYVLADLLYQSGRFEEAWEWAASSRERCLYMSLGDAYLTPGFTNQSVSGISLDVSLLSGSINSRLTARQRDKAELSALYAGIAPVPKTRRDADNAPLLGTELSAFASNVNYTEDDGVFKQSLVWAGPNMRVAGVEPGDTLKMRAGPGREYTIINRVPPDVRDLKPIYKADRADGKRWVFVRWQTDGSQGWVSSMYLAQQGSPEEENAISPPPSKEKAVAAPTKDAEASSDETPRLLRQSYEACCKRLGEPVTRPTNVTPTTQTVLGEVTCKMFVYQGDQWKIHFCDGKAMSINILSPDFFNLKSDLKSNALRYGASTEWSPLQHAYLGESLLSEDKHSIVCMRENEGVLSINDLSFLISVGYFGGLERTLRFGRIGDGPDYMSYQQLDNETWAVRHENGEVFYRVSQKVEVNGTSGIVLSEDRQRNKYDSEPTSRLELFIPDRNSGSSELLMREVAKGKKGPWH